MIKPNRLSNPGENAALARVRAVVERLDAAPIERIGLSPAHGLSPRAHARLIARLEEAADRAGRRELLDDVREHARAGLAHRFSPLVANTGIGFATPVNTAARPADEARIVMAVVDAIAVAVMEDRLDPATAVQLSEPGRRLLGLPPIADVEGGRFGPGVEPGARMEAPESPGLEPVSAPPPASAGPEAESGPPRDTGDVEPSAHDWAEAAAGSTRIDGGYAPIPATPRIVLAVVAACVLGPAALFVGVAGGSTLVGIAAGLAVVALCWLFAADRR